MKKTSWDSYLKEQKRNPRFRLAFEEESRALRIGATGAPRDMGAPPFRPHLAKRRGFTRT
jgi:hypothetical protein